MIEAPQDDTPRLIYADWLDENGEPERAAFIRLQIELAKCPPGPEEAIKARHLLERHRKGAPVRMNSRTTATLLMKQQLFIQEYGLDRLAGMVLPYCWAATSSGEGWRI